jgi:hypothetical protein
VEEEERKDNMEKTIQKMKDTGLFDSLIENILKKDMPEDAVSFALDEICAMDENFEEIFFNDLHEVGLDIIWNELCWEAEMRKVEDLKKQETVEDLLKKIIELLSK